MTEAEWQLRARISPPPRDPDTELLEEALAEVEHLKYRVERLTLRAEGAEQQASRAIARLANAVEAVRAEADRYRRHGNLAQADALAQAAFRLHLMALP